jgi:hypothetical protein
MVLVLLMVGWLSKLWCIGYVLCSLRGINFDGYLRLNKIEIEK